MNNSNELTHYGVLGMKWGKRKAGIASTQKRRPPRGAKTDGPPTKSNWRKKYEDDNGINPNRPNGTSARGKKVASGFLKTTGTMAVGTLAGAAGAYLVIASMAKSIVDSFDY